jgi:trehalose 6-phosphate phosphatase
MKNLLLPRHREMLERHKRGDSLLAFDFDGTLVPLAYEPGGVYLSPRTSEHLHVLSEKYCVAVITGRASGDVARWLSAFPHIHVIGNHGAEGGPGRGRLATSRQIVRDWLSRGIPESIMTLGVEIENKKLSLSLHYRRSARPRASLSAVLNWTKSLRKVHVVMGKDVVNVVPKGAPDKGVALAWLLKKHGLKTALYMGDDVTDESVFRRREIQRGRWLGIHVEKKKMSAAPYYVPHQRDVDRVLAHLAK